MENSAIRNNIIEALRKVFIFVDSTVNGDVDLETYIEDSIQFMSLIVELEQIFDIEFPAELLLLDNFRTINNISVVIDEIISINNKY